MEPAGGGGRHAEALERLSLRSLLTGILLLVLAFSVLVGALLEVHRRRSYRLVNELVTVDNVVSDLALKSTAGMVDARRLEKDFLLYDREYGLDEARSRYITRLVTALVEIGEDMDRIRALSREGEMQRITREVDDGLAAYREGILELVRKHEERGDLDRGAYGTMRAEARRMEELARATGSDALLAGYLLVRLQEKNYVERELDRDADALRRDLGSLRGAAAAAPLPPGPRAQFLASAARYLEHFETYAARTGEIREVKRRYLNAVQRIDPLLEELYVRSLSNVTQRQRELAATMGLIRLPVIAAGGFLFLAIALFSILAVVRVTRAVDETRAFAERVAAGDLGGRIAPHGGRELAALADALNTMAQSLQRAEFERGKHEAELRESEERYRAFVETSADWIWAIDTAGRHTYSNDRVLDILGIEPRALLAGALPELLHPEDAPRAAAILAGAVAGGAGWQGVTLRWRHRDGTYRLLESSAVPVRDGGGNLVGFRGVDRDVTERALIEEERVRAQKLEAVGRLAGGIAHDFNNLLQGLFGFISLAKRSLDRPESARERLEQAQRALGLAVNLTSQLLTFSRGGGPAKRRMELAPLLEDPLRFALSGSRSDYRIAAASDLRPVDVDPGQVGQILQNLALNAAEAMPEGGTVEVAAGNASVAPGANPLVPEGGDFVRVDVMDRGAGVAAELRDRIFDPYFTTKESGSGLGLATSYSIARAHGGFIEVAPRAGGGSVFSVYLPAAASAEPAEAPAPGAAVGRPGRILVMDDEELVRDVAAGMLAELGHAATVVASGEEALVAYEQACAEGRPFDAVILDLTVKRGMGGEETMRRLLAADPAVTAVVSSGYSDAPVVADYRAHGFVACLAKPYRLDALRELLAGVLGDVPAAAGREGPLKR